MDLERLRILKEIDVCVCQGACREYYWVEEFHPEGGVQHLMGLG